MSNDLIHETNKLRTDIKSFKNLIARASLLIAAVVFSSDNLDFHHRFGDFLDG